VVLNGEVSRRIEFAQEDKIEKKNPKVGDYSFNVKEVFPFDEAVLKMFKHISVALSYDDPEIMKKVESVKEVVSDYPGVMAFDLDIHYGDGHIVHIDLGKRFRVNPSMDFFSKLGKIVPQEAIKFPLIDKIYLDPQPERKWSK
jgi:hypothetical protein